MESIKPITDIYMILVIVLGVNTIIVWIIIIIAFYFIYNTKRDKFIKKNNKILLE